MNIAEYLIILIIYKYLRLNTFITQALYIPELEFEFLLQIPDLPLLSLPLMILTLILITRLLIFILQLILLPLKLILATHEFGVFAY